MATKKRALGWIPDVPDIRDLQYEVSDRIRSLAVLPPVVDLSPNCSPIKDQGQLGSCTGQALSALMEFDQLKFHKTSDLILSALFIYYCERAVEKTVSVDSGAQIRTGMKCLNTTGICSETIDPYVVSKFKKKPTKVAYANALTHKAVQYARIPQTLDALKSCLADGFPFVFGFTVYESFETTTGDTGVLNMPKANEENLGGHAVMCVGYNDNDRTFLIRNSWGTDWGKKGYFTMPYDYLLNPNLADDIWTARSVS